VRGHQVIGHTADVGLKATAADSAALFEEAASALAELSADVALPARLVAVDVQTEAHDLAELAYRWLNELIGLAEDCGEALARTEVSSVRGHGGGWRLRGRAWFAPFGGASVRPRLQVKAATMHGLRVEGSPDGWELEVYLDV
jgi:SHS2 domain-containing protein